MLFTINPPTTPTNYRSQINKKLHLSSITACSSTPSSTSLSGAAYSKAYPPTPCERFHQATHYTQSTDRRGYRMSGFKPFNFDRVDPPPIFLICKHRKIKKYLIAREQARS